MNDDKSLIPFTKCRLGRSIWSSCSSRQASGRHGRQNAYTVLIALKSHIQDPVKLALASHIQEKIGRDTLDRRFVRVAIACDAFP